MEGWDEQFFGSHKGKLVCPWFMFWHSTYITLKYKQFLTFQIYWLEGIIGFRHQIAACEGHSKHRVATYLSICTQYTCHVHQHRAISVFVFYLYYRNIPQCTVHTSICYCIFFCICWNIHQYVAVFVLVFVGRDHNISQVWGKFLTGKFDLLVVVLIRLSRSILTDLMFHG